VDQNGRVSGRAQPRLEHLQVDVSYLAVGLALLVGNQNNALVDKQLNLMLYEFVVDGLVLR